MKLLFTGRGTSGSWRIRGEQLGKALGATVEPKSTRGDHDLAVVVKRASVAQVASLGRWVLDIVDPYPQPASYHWNRDQAITWVRGYIQELKPNAVIWPTQRMREDCDTGLPGLVLPHHHRPGLVGNADPKLVGYEGGERYLGKWRPALEAECSKRGLAFVVNPPDYSRLSVVVALREGGGYVCRHFKSGVKHSNAVAIGARFIGQPECGYVEQACGREEWVESPADLGAALDRAKPLIGTPYTVAQAAVNLKAFLYAL